MKPTPFSIEISLSLPNNESPVLCVVEGKYYHATPDVHYLSNGDPGYPGDPAEVEVTSVIEKDSKVVHNTDELSDDDIKEILTKVEENISDYEDGWGEDERERDQEEY